MIATFKCWEEKEINFVKKQAKKVKVSSKEKDTESLQKRKHSSLAREKGDIALASRETGPDAASKGLLNSEGR